MVASLLLAAERPNVERKFGGRCLEAELIAHLKSQGVLAR